VVRAFVRLREVLATHKALAKKLEDLEKKTEALALKHDTLAANTRAQFREVIEALRALMTPPETQEATHRVHHARRTNRKEINRA
jgi:hypothetical protein